MKSHLREKKKSGSALLVVLGFLSFMVVSAVAFAIYMRAERVPSSALRRNVATRHLVKAAMAHAMSRVDDAMRNDPFPGVVNTNGNAAANFYHDGGNNAMDVWYGRVFMPPNPEGLEDDNGNRVQAANDPGNGDFAWRFAPVTETVSVLNLEALGYIPPPLVNDVRFLSRSTWTAKWQNFPFDAGRFAFCAVNVSDYFDINRTKVGLRSSPLDSCISLLGTITAKRNQDGSFGMEKTMPDVTTLSQILGPNATGRQSYSNPDGTGGSQTGGTVPYVSMLDYNLALGNQSYAGDLVHSLFYPWIMNQGNGLFYGGAAMSSQGIQQAMRQPFVTDSFFAASNTANQIDYATLDGQPFFDINMSDNLSLDGAMMSTKSPFLKRMYDRDLVNEIDVAFLYDYLDHNDIPISLAMPSVECVPMVTAVELVKNNFCKLQLKGGETTTEPQSIGREFTGTETKTTIYKLHQDSFAQPGVRVLVAFPFRHFDGRDTGGFNVQVVMKVFATSATQLSIRPSKDDVNVLASLHPDPVSQNGWKESKPFEIGGEAKVVGYTFCSEMTPIPDKLFKGLLKGEDKLQEKALVPVDVVNWKGGTSEPEFFTIVKKQEYEKGFKKGEAKSYYQLNLRPFGSDGKVNLPDGEQEGDVTAASFANEEFRLHVMMWVRITDASGTETYDLAPAVLADDALNPNGAQNAGSVMAGVLGTPIPGCLLFSGNSAFKYADFTPENLDAQSVPGLNGNTDPQWRHWSLATVDPRYNYAPEDWFAWDQNVSAKAWLEKISQAGCLTGADHDHDIFMFTSNQGYLQSLGEFAFLPDCQNLSSDTKVGTEWQDYETEPERIRNFNCVWRTRRIDRSFYDACLAAGIVRSPLPTVNPYSDNEHVLLAAFANTPCDYWTTGRIAAGMKKEDLSDDFAKIVDKIGDNSAVSGQKIDPKDKDKVLDHAFCENNKSEPSSNITFEEIFGIMRDVTSAIRASAAAESWEVAYDNLFKELYEELDGQNNYTETDRKSEMFDGLRSCLLYSIDRKFLYSYWRDCFANRQQLFLLFVRAESTALGGPGEGTPAQQGGRAVALVWREPQSNRTNGGQDGASDDRQVNYKSDRRPHRMRVLFYHQFD